MRFLSLLLCVMFLFSPAAFAEETEPVQERYIAPTPPPGAIPYDPAHPEILDEDMIYALSAIVVEANTGEVLFEKNADQVMFPASTTKILTAYIALQMADLENDVVTVSQNAIDMVPSNGYTTVPLVAGEQIRMEDLIAAMLIKSGNDAANAIAEFISGSIENFANLMNETAQMLGCSQDTHFTNPSGVQDINHYTTARDLAIIASAAMKNERFASLVQQTAYELPATEREDGRAAHPKRMIYGHTDILNPESDLFYPYATGVKTGFTNDAGYCFVGAASKNGIDLISVVLYGGDHGRYRDTQHLMEYGFTQMQSISPESLYAEDPRVIDVMGFDTNDPMHGELTLGIRAVDETKDMTIIGRADKIDMLRQNFGQISSIKWTREFRAPINVGDVMGILTFYSENKGTAEYELVATRSIAARENAPLTLEQIEAYTAADENPWPRFSWDLLVPPGLLLLVLILIIRFIHRHIHRRIKAPKIKPVKKRYLR